jgi:hypothetical protein
MEREGTDDAGRLMLLVDVKLPAHVLCVGIKNRLGTIIARDPERRKP